MNTIKCTSTARRRLANPIGTGTCGLSLLGLLVVLLLLGVLVVLFGTRVYFLFGTACLVLLVLLPTVAVANLFVDDIVLFFISVHIAHQFAKHLSPNKTYEGYTSKILFEFALKSCVDESYKKKIQKGLDALPPSKSSKRSSSSSSSR